MWDALMHKTTPQGRERWGADIIALHWGTAACVVILLETGWQLGAHAAHIGQRTVVLQWHASLGILLLAATMVRILARLVVGCPSAFARGRLPRVSARVVQAALYVALLALIVTGIMTAAPRPFTPAVQLFGLSPLPKIVGIPPALTRNMPGVHAALVWIFLGLIGLHVAAAIHGTFIRGDRTIFRMLPWPKRRQRT